MKDLYKLADLCPFNAHLSVGYGGWGREMSQNPQTTFCNAQNLWRLFTGHCAQVILPRRDIFFMPVQMLFPRGGVTFHVLLLRPLRDLHIQVQVENIFTCRCYWCPRRCIYSKGKKCSCFFFCLKMQHYVFITMRNDDILYELSTYWYKMRFFRLVPKNEDQKLVQLFAAMYPNLHEFDRVTSPP